MATITADGAGCSMDDQTLLAPTDLVVAPGEAIALRGRNGSGKTTLLRLLAGRVRPTVGRVTYADAPMDERRSDVRADIATLIGTPALYPDLTVREQLRLIGATWRIPRGDLEARVESVLDEFALAPLATRFAHELSSGQTQMYHLATTFVRPSRVLLLDEPEQRLDAEWRRRLAAALRRATDAGAAAVFATHDDGLARDVAHRVHRLRPAA